MDIKIPYTLFVQLYNLTAETLNILDPSDPLYQDAQDAYIQLEKKALAICRRQEYKASLKDRKTGT